MELTLAAQAKRPKGETRCDPVGLPDVDSTGAAGHLKVLREAGIVASEKQGLWAYYHVLPGALEPLAAWLEATTDLEGTSSCDALGVA